jgi:hypothetical protein
MNTLSAFKPTSTLRVSQKPLKAGLWLDGSFDWYSEEDTASHPGGQLRTLIQSFSKQHISFVKCTVKNTSVIPKLPKFMFHYDNACNRQTVAFYSPGEQAILHVAPHSIALIGGLVRGKGISQYCIQGKGSLYQNGCFKSLKEGILSYSPLARGEVSSIFTLETEILPHECIEAIAWIIHANEKEEAIMIQEKLMETIRNLSS